MLERARPPEGPESSSDRSHGTTWLVVGIVVFVLVVAGVGIGLERTAPSPNPVGPPAAVVNGSFSVNTTAALALPPFALGINARANYGLGPDQATWTLDTPVRLVRWPGGNLSDRMDALAGLGRIYDSSGASVPAATSLAQFVSWCRLVGGSAILTLPGEIDNSTYAAELARAVTVSLGFAPAYWEVGNEPSLWTHWGIPWSEWNTSQRIGPTPGQYAEEVAAYISAVRSVDPSAHFLGLPGVGTGANDPEWIGPVVALEGANLSGVAIHVYPAGPTSSKEPVTAFLGTLDGSDSVAVRASVAFGAIRSACPSCQIPLLIDEIGSVTGTAYPSYASGYDAAPYLATEIVQGLTQGVDSIALWNLESTYPAAWANSHGNLGPTHTLYTTFLSHLPSTMYPVVFSPYNAGLYGLAGVTPSAGGGTLMVFLINTNTTFAFRLSLSAAGFPVGAGTEGWTWSPGHNAPSGPLAIPSNETSVVLPPLGLGLWEAPGTTW